MKLYENVFERENIEIINATISLGNQFGRDQETDPGSNEGIK